MSPTVAPEQLSDTQLDPHEIRNLSESSKPEHREALMRMRSALMSGLWKRRTEVSFGTEGDRGSLDKEMHDWFGTPDWYLRK